MRSKHLGYGLVLTLIAACLVAPPLCAGQAQHERRERASNPVGTGGGETLPDIPALLKQVEKNQQRLEQNREKYSFTDIEEQDRIGRDGHVTHRSVRQYDAFFLNGNLIRRMVKKNGKPLSASAQKKEDARVRKLVERYERKSSESHAGNGQDVGVGLFLRACRFSNPHWTTLNGRRVLAFNFSPKPAFKPQSKAGKLVHDLGGVMWVDARAGEVVRLEAGLDNSYRIAGGLLASIEKGTTVKFEQKLVGGHVWMPSYFAFDASARLLLFKGERVNVTDRYSHYRVFSVHALGKIVPPGGPAR